MEECDDCWEHVSDWSPFAIWHCLLCRMPQARFDGCLAPVRCEFCGWDEATECGHIEFENENGKLIEYHVEYDAETREVVSRTRQDETK